jgi:DNA-directed RNA polymerase subunit RPC12/RpoP
MNKRIYIENTQPKCKTCGKQVNEWMMGQTEFEHVECSSSRIAESMMKPIRKHLNQIKV